MASLGMISVGGLFIFAGKILSYFAYHFKKSRSMARHNETGKRGELLACRFLREKKWKILEVNWRWGRAEVDIIAMDGDILVFIEVKTRTTARYGVPEGAVSEKKMELIAAAATEYMTEIGHEWEIRFDVISIFLPSGQPPMIRHLPDAFFPGL